MISSSAAERSAGERSAEEEHSTGREHPVGVDGPTGCFPARERSKEGEQPKGELYGREHLKGEQPAGGEHSDSRLFGCLQFFSGT